MNTITKFLFPNNVTNKNISVALLIIRVVFGILLMTHGWDKLVNFSAYQATFLGGGLGLGLMIFAEFFCAMGIITGFLFRLALIPPIIGLVVAFFAVHSAKLVGAGNGELPLLYIAAFIALYLAGPGEYAIDKFMADRFNAKPKTKRRK